MNNKLKFNNPFKKNKRLTLDEMETEFTPMTIAQRKANKAGLYGSGFGGFGNNFGGGGFGNNYGNFGGGGWRDAVFNSLPPAPVFKPMPQFNPGGSFGGNNFGSGSSWQPPSKPTIPHFQPQVFAPSPVRPYTPPPPMQYTPSQTNYNTPVAPVTPAAKKPVLDLTPPSLATSPRTNPIAETGGLRSTLEKTGNTDPLDSLYGTKDMRTIGFIAKHPIIAAQIGSYEKNSTNISTNTVRFANSQKILAENKTKGQENMGSQVNAFRHSLWQATIAQKFGEEIAREVGAAHEDNPSANLSQRTFKTMTDADQTIDMLNNQIGRQIGKENPNSSMKGLAIKTLNHFAEKGLYVASMQKDGTFNVSQGKVTPEQYRSLLNRFQQLNDNGFTPDQQQERDLAAQKKSIY